MNKNFRRITIVLLLIIAILSGITFLQQQDKLRKRKERDKALEQQTIIEDAVEYVALEKLPKDYTMEGAITDGCLVITNKGTIYRSGKDTSNERQSGKRYGFKM